VLRRRDPARLAAGEGDPVERRAAVRAGALEDQLAAARGPARAFVEGAVGQQLLAGPVGLDHADARAGPGHAAGEGDRCTVRAPHRRRIPAAAEAHPALTGPVGVHHIELLRAGAVAFEDDLLAVGAEARVGVDAGRGGQALDAAAARTGDIDVGVGAGLHREEDALAVGR